MTAREDLSVGIPADAGGIDPHDPHDGGGESVDDARGPAGREDDRTGGSGSETGEFALPSMRFVLCDDPTQRTHAVFTCLLGFFFHLVQRWRFYSYVLIWPPLLLCYAPESPKTDGRRRWLRGHGTFSSGVDVRVSAPVEGNEGGCPRLDPGSGSMSKVDRPTGFGRNAKDDEGAKTRAVSTGSFRAARGERQITTLVEPTKPLPGACQ